MAQTLPREVTDGVFWLGDCLEQHFRGKVYHAYNAAFLVVGETAAMLVETGHPKDFPAVERQMREVLDRTSVPLRHLFLTHQETPHAGGLGRVLRRWPEAIVHGDLSDYHLAFPGLADRMQTMEIGDSVDLGGRRFVAVEPVVRDLRTSLWGFDTGANCLFPGDGFAYSHYHLDGHCGLFAEEAVSLDLADVSAVFADRALFWTKFADMRLYTERLERLLADFDVRTIAPTHGLPIRDLASTVPKVLAGLIAESGVTSPPSPSVDE